MSNNMELENMKNAWQSLSNADLKKDIDKDAIEKMMRSKSKSELNKLILTFVIELLVSIPIIIVGMAWIRHLGSTSDYVWVFDVFMVGAVVFLLIPMRRFLKLGKFREQSTVVYLEKLTSIFDQVIKTVLNFSRVFIAVSFPIGMLLGGLDVHEEWMIFIISMLICMPFYFGLMFLLKWYYRFFYGRRIARMKEYLRELKVDLSGEDADDYDKQQEVSALEVPIRKGKLYKLIIVCSILVALIMIAGVILYFCGYKNGVGYYIGYGLGWTVRTIQDWFVS